MADYFAQAVVHEDFPADKLTERDQLLLGAFGFEVHDDGNGSFNLTCEEGWQDELDADQLADDFDPDEVDEILGEAECLGIFDYLQGLMGRCGMPVITMEIAFTCSKMRLDGFGGAGYVITPDAVHSMSTAEWIEKKLDELGLLTPSPADAAALALMGEAADA
ncbi:MAG: hypothetical protein RJA36_1414 [Pseudomonadota bacterium]|jgi:hypothetical protein